MPIDSYYDRLDEAEDNRRFQYEKNLRERMESKTFEEKVDFLIEEYIRDKMSKY